MEDLSITQLRKVIRYYNLHTSIKGERGMPLSKLPKESLIKHILSKMTYKDGELVINPNLNRLNINEITSKRSKHSVKKEENTEKKRLENKISEIEIKLTKTKNSKEIGKLLTEKFELEEQLENL